MALRIAALMLASLTALSAQSYPTRVAMDGLLSLRYFPAQGEFMLEPIRVLFPPPGTTKARLVIKTPAGAAVVGADVEVAPYEGYPAFGSLQGAYGAPVSIGPIPAGSYVLSVELAGKEITAFPFSLTRAAGADPFNPSNELVRSGPWSKAAFLVNPVERPGEAVALGVWLNSRDLPGGGARQVPISVHLLLAGKPVAQVDGAVTGNDWEFYRFDLRHKTPQAAAGPFTWAILAARPGAYTIEVRAGGKVARSYAFTVADGKIRRIPSNELGYAGTDALPPQSIMALTGATQRVEQYWLAPIR